MTPAKTSSQAPTFSVVIPVKDSVAFLEDLVAALQTAQEPEGGREVIFVDDRSRDGSYEKLQQLAVADERLRVVRGPGRGPEAARNAGVREATGQFVVFTDADTIPDPDWLRVALAYIREKKVRALEGAVMPWSSQEPGYLYRMPLNLDGGRFMTANMVYERSLLEEVNGLDESFDQVLGLPHFLGDTDLAFRVMDTGVEIPFVPQVRVRHRHIPMAPKGFLRDQAKIHWMPHLARRHPARFREVLRPKVQAMRPGDADFLLAVPLFLATRRSNRVARTLAAAALLIAVRRVIGGVDLARVPARQKPAWIGALVVAPGIRAVSLVWGWIRFRRITI